MRALVSKTIVPASNVEFRNCPKTDLLCLKSSTSPKSSRKRAGETHIPTQQNPNFIDVQGVKRAPIRIQLSQKSVLVYGTKECEK